MYGFERMRSNECSGDFEQLVINFANEKLQQVLIKFYNNCNILIIAERYKLSLLIFHSIVFQIDDNRKDVSCRTRRVYFRRY